MNEFNNMETMETINKESFLNNVPTGAIYGGIALASAAFVLTLKHFAPKIKDGVKTLLEKRFNKVVEVRDYRDISDYER